FVFFFSSRRRHTILVSDWSSDVCSSDLSSLVDTQKPLVFTGAQLAHDHPQSDGPRNVIDAIHAAASEETQGLGAMVCFNGELHRSEERRVGKEWRVRGRPSDKKKKSEKE